MMTQSTRIRVGGTVLMTLACLGVLLLPIAPGISAEKPAAKTDEKTADQQATRIPPRPRLPGVLKLRLRSRHEEPKGSGKFKVTVKEVEWQAAETAIIICDMWDNHYCQSAAQRVDAMAPKMNRVITAARNHGVAIIHSPSGTTGVYKNTPFRRRMQQSLPAKSPVPIQKWCYLNPKKEAAMPVDTSKQSCDDPVIGERVRRYSRQHAGIKMIGYDGVSDNGQEIYNFLHQERIKNVVLMGVHTNMCVLGRPFGIRQMKYLGLNVVLARDLTDAMYDPRQFPYVSHTRGTELVIEHIENYWCPSILGVDLTKVIPGSADPDPEVVKRGPQPVTAKKE